MALTTIHTQNAPEAIGTYSQAVKCAGLIFLSGQIPLDPRTMQLVEGNAEQQIRRVLKNISAVCQAAGGDLSDIVKLTVYLTDLSHFPMVNEVMGQFFAEPYPARAAVGVTALPKAATVEMDAIMLCRS